jgi:HTH-type transcriptional regulator/antitoxin HigA
MKNIKNNYMPPHVGEYIQEELETREWSQQDLAYILGKDSAYINKILAGRHGVSPEMAKALAKAFDMSPEFFLNLQKAYDLSRATEPDASVSFKASIQNQYPIREMIKRGWIKDTNTDLLKEQFCRFFGVEHYDAIPHLSHAAKKTYYEDISSIQLAWLFRVKQIANELIVPAYSKQALEKALDKLKALTIDAPEVRHVSRILAECGVRFLIVETLPSSKIDGVCFWLDEHSPVVGMSLRFDRIDNFWFVLRHELEHVLQGDAKEGAILDIDVGLPNEDGADLPEEEKRANEASANWNVEKSVMDSFVARKYPFIANADVINFAKLLKIHPGIVIGQLHARTKEYDKFRKHLVKVRQYLMRGTNVDGWGEVYPAEL